MVLISLRLLNIKTSRRNLKILSVTTMTSPVSFAKRMRVATRGVHDVSDALVNFKLGIAVTDDAVWAEGILVFYEVFKYLEEAMDRLGHTLVGDLDIPGMRRTQAFEKDLKFYLGKDWQENYQPRAEVSAYLTHLKTLEETDPHMLIAYIYHLYMGLFSGGQILRKKRELEIRLKLKKRVALGEGEALTDFGNNNVATLKKCMAEATEKIAVQLGPEEQEKLIEESKNVFRFNNAMIRTIRGTNQVIWNKVVKVAAIVIPCVAGWYIVKRWF